MTKPTRVRGKLIGNQEEGGDVFEMELTPLLRKPNFDEEVLIRLKWNDSWQGHNIVAILQSEECEHYFPESSTDPKDKVLVPSWWKFCPLCGKEKQ